MVSNVPSPIMFDSLDARDELDDGVFIVSLVLVGSGENGGRGVIGVTGSFAILKGLDSIDAFFLKISAVLRVLKLELFAAMQDVPVRLI